MSCTVTFTNFSWSTDFINMAYIICMPPRRRVGVHINLSLSVRPSGYRYMVCPAISSYSFGATALIFCRMFIHIMEVCRSTGFWFSSNILKRQVVGLGHFVRPSGYRYMVCPAISSYSFGVTALIFCRMFIHIMEVCMSTGFWWSGGGIICVLQTRFILKKSLLTKPLCP
jgi:hypothetical protein